MTSDFLGRIGRATAFRAFAAATASASLAAAGLLLFSTAPSRALETFDIAFANPASSGGSEDAIDPYAMHFSGTLTADGPGFVVLTVRNASPAGYIGSLNIDDAGGAISGHALNHGNVGLVEFKDSGAGTLPQSNNVDPLFSSDLEFAAKNGPRGVHAGEAFGVRLVASFDGLAALFQTGALRVGLHVRGIDDARFSGASDILVSTYIPPPDTPDRSFQPPSSVPLPAAVWMLGAGLGALGAAGRRRRRRT